MTARRLILASLLLVLAVFAPCCHSYRVGDANEPEIWKPKDTAAEEAPMRNQMALFGLDSKFKAKLSQMPGDYFSISFEEGFRALPWIYKKNGSGYPLEKLLVTFVYSRSGGGEIHSLSHQAIYNKDRKDGDEVTVEYKWIEEESVDLNSGAFVMFLSVFIVSIYFLFDLCGLCDSGDSAAEPFSPSFSVPDGQYAGSRAVDPLAAMSGANIPKYE